MIIAAILAGCFFREFSNGHGSRAPCSSPQKKLPAQQTECLLVARGGFVISAAEINMTLAPKADAMVPWKAEHPDPCCWLSASQCSQLALEGEGGGGGVGLSCWLKHLDLCHPWYQKDNIISSGTGFIWPYFVAC